MHFLEFQDFGFCMGPGQSQLTKASGNTALQSPLRGHLQRCQMSGCTLETLEKQAFGCGHPWPERAERGGAKKFGQKNIGLIFLSLRCQPPPKYRKKGVHTDLLTAWERDRPALSGGVHWQRMEWPFFQSPKNICQRRNFPGKSLKFRRKSDVRQISGFEI